MAKTKIEWCDTVWNPVTGCTKVSEGCRNCYAERMAKRFWGERKFTDVQYHPDRLNQPYHWKKPQRVFVNSMSDLFHNDVPDQFIGEVFWRMQHVAWHTYIVLTKRPKRMFEFLTKYPDQPVLTNVLLLVSVENQETADERIPWLLQTPAAVRGVSVEPMLGPIDLNKKELICKTWRKGATIGTYLDWVIVGGETGPGARTMDPYWVRSIKNQCQDANVPFFFKGWGEWTTLYPQGLSLANIKQTYTNKVFYRVGKKYAGRELDGRTWEEVPGEK